MSDTTARVLYRYSEAVNLKARPPYFSKLLAIVSFARAVEATAGRVRVTFVVDGPARAEALALMRSVGVLARVSCGSNRASYRAAVAMVGQTANDTLTWFAEDDYLYHPDALVALLAAADAIPEADWFGLSGPTPPELLEMRRAQGPVTAPPLSRPGGVAVVQGAPWRRIDSTTSTFGGRTEAVRRDRRLLRAVPWSGAAWDRTTCLAVQGIAPYPWPHVLSDLVVDSTPKERRAARIAWRVLTRGAVNLRACRAPGTRGLMVAPVTPLVGHMNLPFEERPEHWESVASQTAGWASDRGVRWGAEPGRA